jgi:hypothetical protein
MVYIEVTWGREVKPLLTLHSAHAEFIMIVNDRGAIFMAC